VLAMPGLMSRRPVTARAARFDVLTSTILDIKMSACARR
jgi:hypothetical protein